MTEILHFATLPAIGLGIGIIVGLTGVGGGSLMTPILVGGLGISPAIAVGTDLLFAALTKSFGGWAHWKRGNVASRLLRLLIVSSLFGAALAFAGVQALSPNVDVLNHVIRTSLGVALFATAAALLIRPWLLRWRAQRAPASPALDVTGNPLPTVILGVLIGMVVTISSIGAGAIGVTALLLLHPALPLSRIVGTDIAYAVPLTAVAGLAHATAGHVDYALLGGLLIGSIPGILLGAKLSSRVPEVATRGLLVGLLGIAGTKLVA